MSWVLGSATLKAPRAFKRVPVRGEVVHQELDGGIAIDVLWEKEKFILEFDMLTPTQYEAIKTEFQNKFASFHVNETNLTITSRDVLVEMSDLTYIKGGSYKGRLVLTLTDKEAS